MNSKQHLPFGLFLCFVVYFVLLYTELARSFAATIPNTWVAVILFGTSGSLLPDTDIPALGIEHHRSIITHSAIFPLLAFYAYWYYGLGIAAMAMFCIGYTSHLFLDLFPSTTGVKDLKNRETWSGAKDQWRVSRKGYEISERTFEKLESRRKKQVEQLDSFAKNDSRASKSEIAAAAIASPEGQKMRKDAPKQKTAQKLAAASVAKSATKKPAKPSDSGTKKHFHMDAPGAVKPAKILHWLHCPDGLWLFLNGLVTVIITLVAYATEYKWLLAA